MAKRFATTTEAAKALGVSQPFLSQVLSGTHGAGMTLLDGLAKVTGLTVDEIRRGATQPSNVSPSTATHGTMGTWMGRLPAGALDGWDQAVLEAKARPELAGVPAWAWDEAARLAVPPGAQATVDVAADLAYFAWRHIGPGERAQLEASAQDAAASRLRTPPSDYTPDLTPPKATKRSTKPKTE